ncbi:MFS transporter [Collinsella intestinalis]|uniref:MFS transporter n=2 Tax=Collinsella intestinalis TaxID=147207 RepID=A0A414NDS2_9ACTN|nr:MFS transporter [Collinsella intestinalis]
MVMDMSSTCACKERVEVARGQGGSVGSKATISLAVLALAQLGVSADNGAFSVAMSEMMSVFGCSVADVQLANTVYALMAGTFMLASGLLGLMVGWRRTFVGGMVLMVIGEIVTALAPVVELLIWGGRLAVGVGASLVIPSVLGMVPLLFEGDKRKQAYGVIAGSAALATIVPIPLGMLVDNFGFRFTFGALVAASLALPASQPRASKKFDLVGAALASMGLFAVMFGLSRISAWGVADPLPTAPFTIFGLSPAPFIVIAGVALLIVLIPVESWMEREHDVAILPSSFIKSAQVRSGVVAIALPFFYMGAQGLVATSFYQLVVGLGGTSTALLGIVSGVPMLVLAMGIPRKFPQVNSWLVVRCGYIAIALGAIMAAFGVRGSELTSIMVLGTLLGGIGVGMVNSQSNNLVASAVPAHDAQQSGGIQGAARNLGLALGSAAMGSVMLIAVNMGLDARVESTAVLDEPVRTALEQTVYTYEGDLAFSARMDGMGVSDPVAGELIAANREVRANAGAIAMSTVAALAGLALFTTFPKRSKDAAGE